MQWAAMGLMMYIRAMRSRYQNGNSLPSTAPLCMVGRPALQGLLWAGQDGTVPQPGKRQAPPVVKDEYKRGRLWYGVPPSTCNDPHLLSKSEKKNSHGPQEPAKLCGEEAPATEERAFFFLSRPPGSVTHRSRASILFFTLLLSPVLLCFS
ncbi:hypothetical protein NW767_003466 [Fusarium falciforme]|uniref:Uncharacterized protein n=1 Tax=Fusarium falciforme TaxID=195108 RepID=A0A9W8V5N5_9HYPO|nr:hypothetical protein NW755_000647 [Fusarium falciforme]KAJ4206218.1 hypothetical protein NW767_003466 [Fusarium falciforme]KAJ4262192.1 hypothetical protein NW757_000458 [Fusarium falciforme]